MVLGAAMPGAPAHPFSESRACNDTLRTNRDCFPSQIASYFVLSPLLVRDLSSLSVIGRTGSGKSSLMMALLRTCCYVWFGDGATEGGYLSRSCCGPCSHSHTAPVALC